MAFRAFTLLASLPVSQEMGILKHPAALKYLITWHMKMG